jgi:Tol biopolymer transport system component
MTETPRSVHATRPSVPPAMDAAILRALAKVPADRFASCGAFAQALTATASPRSPAGRLTPILWGAAALAAAAVVTTLLLRTRTAAPLPGIGRTIQVTRDPGLEIDPALSPDGTILAYAQGTPTRMQIYVQQVGGGRRVALTSDSTDSFRSPKWSPDGTQLAFQGNDGIFVAPALGGALRRIVRIDALALRARTGMSLGATTLLAGLAWSPDGQRLAYCDIVGAILVVPVAGGPPVRVAALSQPSSPAWSPDGSRLALSSGEPNFTFGTGYLGNVGTSSIRILPVQGGDAIQVTDAKSLNTSPQWSADGRTLYWVSDRGGSRDIYLVDVDRDGRPTGAPRRLTTGLDVHGISLARDGTHLAYSSFRTFSNVWAVPVPRAGTVSATAARPLTTGSQTIEDVDVSPNGEWLAFDSDRGGNPDIYRMATSGGEPLRLTTDSAGDFAPHWSRDGRQLAFHSLRTGNRDVFTMNADGTGLVQRTAAPEQQLDPVWAPGDTALLYESFSDTTTDLQVHRLSGGPDPVRPLALPGDFAEWSPTGEWMAYHAADGIRVVPPEGGRSRLLVDNAEDGGEAFLVTWAPDGRTLYYLSRRPAGWTIRAIPPQGGASRPLVTFDDPTRQPTRYGFATDGRDFYLTLGSHESDLWVMELERR